MSKKIADFNKAASYYDRARPEYPSEAILFITDLLNDCTNCRIVDIAAGTGKLTKKLLISGARVFAVDMSDKMLHYLRLIKGKNLSIIKCNAYNMPFDDLSIDLATIGQAFHWLDFDKCLFEVNRILKVNGLFCLIWNKRDTTSRLFVELDKILERYRNQSPNWMVYDWAAILNDYKLFTPIQKKEFYWDRKMNKSLIIESILSRSYISNLKPQVLEDVINCSKNVIEKYLKKKNNINAKYRTILYWGTKI